MCNPLRLCSLPGMTCFAGQDWMPFAASALSNFSKVMKLFRPEKKSPAPASNPDVFPRQCVQE